MRSAVLVIALGGAALGGCSRTPEPAPATSTHGATTSGDLPTAAPATNGNTAIRLEPPDPAKPACPRDPGVTWQLPTAPLELGGARVTVEIARSSDETERGLMYRTAMADDHGMLFRLGAREEHTFWMHNTCIPLDMLFVDKDGTIVGILEDVPILNDDARTVGRASTHVLELNGGWSHRHGVRAGQRLLLPALAQ